MFGLLSELAELTTNVVKTVVGPIEIVATVANAAVKPIANGVQELVKDAKDSLKE